MSDWEYFRWVVDLVVYAVVVAFSTVLMWKHRQEIPRPDLLVLTYYLGAAGAALNLHDALKQHIPTPGAVLVGTAVAIYLGIRLFGPASPDLRRKP